jgi:hypothetical protein
MLIPYTGEWTVAPVASTQTAASVLPAAQTGLLVVVLKTMYPVSFDTDVLIAFATAAKAAVVDVIDALRLPRFAGQRIDIV